MNCTTPGAVKFAEKNLLPGAKLKTAVVYMDGQRTAGQQGHNMRRRIPFRMTIVQVARDDMFKTANNIKTNIGICTFIDSEPRGGMRIEKKDHPGRNFPTLDDFVKFCCDVDKFHLRCGTDFQFAAEHRFSCINAKVTIALLLTINQVDAEVDAE